MKRVQFLESGALARLVLITLSQMVGLACGLIGVKIVTRLVPPADYGLYGIFLTFTPAADPTLAPGL
jgi:O-antigen/teichoic acid export membrane protein